MTPELETSRLLLRPLQLEHDLIGVDMLADSAVRDYDAGVGGRITDSLMFLAKADSVALTTAFLALRIFNSDFKYEVRPFDQIIDAVVDGHCDAGLLIHEGQLFYHTKGLQKVLDLGEWWYEQTKLPLPLGCTAVRRSHDQKTILQISKFLKESIQYSLDHREEALAQILQPPFQLAPQNQHPPCPNAAAMQPGNPRTP